MLEIATAFIVLNITAEQLQNSRATQKGREKTEWMLCNLVM